MGLGSLVYKAGMRPDADAVVAAASRNSFAVTHNAYDWVELLADGLTFDLAGLAPGPSCVLPTRMLAIGVRPREAWPDAEALDIGVGPHLSGAENLLPVVKIAASLMASLGLATNARAMAWHPAGNLIRIDWFAEAIKAWENGGPFPALALCSFVRQAGGDLISQGLQFLRGQEFHLRAGPADLPHETGKIALRLADWLVAHGRVDAPREVILSGAGALWLEPDGENLLNARKL